MSPLSQQLFKTGFAPMDEEHGDLTRYIGQLVEAVHLGKTDDVRAAAGVLLEKFAAHFAREEHLMGEHRYSQLARHKEAHDMFLADLSRFQEELTHSGLTRSFRTWAIGPLGEWFRFHIMRNDVRLGHFLLSRQRSGEQKRIAPSGVVTRKLS
jgi:hemerythrin-like metal-binding protein